MFHELIGSGTYSKVFRAVNKRTKRIVAMKIIPKDKIDDVKILDHIIDERNVLRQLSSI